MFFIVLRLPHRVLQFSRRGSMAQLLYKAGKGISNADDSVGENFFSRTKPDKSEACGDPPFLFLKADFSITSLELFSARR